jgi:DNA-binding Lrp family transcriptional regulator
MVENIKLDSKDWKILAELDKNSRIFDTALAKKTRCSREIVKYRLKKLESEGVINGYTSVINPAKLGYIIYKVYIKFQNIDFRKEEGIINYLEENENIFWIAKCDGGFDLIFGVYVKNLVEFDNILSDFMKHFSKNILLKEISNSVYVEIYNRGYLDKKNMRLLWGGIPEKEDLDKSEKEVLKKIAYNSRINSVELANTLKTTPKKIITRIKWLEEKGIILGYRVNLNLTKLNKGYFKILVYFQDISREKEENFKSYCMNNPFITYYIKTISNWDAELDIEIDNFEKFNQLIKDIKINFGDLIKTIDTMFISEERKGELNIVQDLS